MGIRFGWWLDSRIYGIRILTHPRKASSKPNFIKNPFTDSRSFFTRTDSTNMSGIRSQVQRQRVATKATKNSKQYSLHSTVSRYARLQNSTVHSEHTDVCICNMVAVCRYTDPVTGTDLLRPEASCPSIHSTNSSHPAHSDGNMTPWDRYS